MHEKEATSRPVVVTTAHRGVFFGYTRDSKVEIIELERARVCLYWSADVRGFMGLAGQGPTKGCRVGPPVTKIELREVTSVIDCTLEAVEAWESAPWGI